MAVRSKRKAGPGRKSLYKDAFADQAKALYAEFGPAVTAAKLGKVLGVGKSTVLDWRAANKAFDAAVREGLAAFSVSAVEKALYKRAVGYSIREVTYEPPDDLDLAEGEALEEKHLVPVKVVKKEVPPDVAAIRYYLNNKEPEAWKDRQSLEASGAGGGPLTVIVRRFSEDEE